MEGEERECGKRRKGRRMKDRRKKGKRSMVGGMAADQITVEGRTLFLMEAAAAIERPSMNASPVNTDINEN